MDGDIIIIQNGISFLMNGTGNSKRTTRYIAGVFELLLSLFCLATLLFFVYASLHSDPVAVIASKSNQAFPQTQLSEEHRQLLQERLGLNKPLSVQLNHFFSNILNGSMGTSFWTGQNVGKMIQSRVLVTARFMIPAFFLFVGLGISWGLFQALQFKKPFGKLALLINAGLFCIPAFSLASGLAHFASPISSSFLALSVYVATTVPTLASLVCDRLLKEETQPYAQAARARGLSRRQLLQRHLIKPCIPSFLSLLPWWWSVVLGTSIIVEPVFRISGIGMLSFEAFRNQDVPVLLGISLLLGGGRIFLGCMRDFLWSEVR
ncbi:MAG: ABC transporter permease [Proteobacteria bacterium]|nr:ABC transporter permease [Pseudomonadota bacterium]